MADSKSEGKVIINNQNFSISVAKRHDSKTWQTEHFTVSGFVLRLSQARRTSETYAEYESKTKDERELLKAGGGCYLGGMLLGHRRTADKVLGRNILTFDADYIGKDGGLEGGGEAFKADVQRVLGTCCYTLHPTRTKPRIRLIVYSERVIKPEEFEPVARMIANDIGMHWFDPVSFRLAQLYYWPSVSSDVDYWIIHNDMPSLVPEAWLNRYNGAWQDCSLWPVSDLEGVQMRKDISRQADPLKKRGAVGAFCRAYTIAEAIDKFIPTEYRKHDGGRYTYAHGSSIKGAVLYGDGKWLYSNHSTDPVSGKLVNSFDLVRIHLYGALDNKVIEGTPTTDTPSYKAMLALCKDDSKVIDRLNQEVLEAFDSFQDETERNNEDISPEGYDPDTGEETGKEKPRELETWRRSLQRNDKLNVRTTQLNANLIIEHECSQVFYDDFSERRYVVTGDGGYRLWTEDDFYANLHFMNHRYGLDFPRQKAEDAFSRKFGLNRRNLLGEWLLSLEWDGVERGERFFIDHLGVEDTPLNREMTRCWLLGAFRRGVYPGYEFHNALIFSGEQGVGKSSILRLLATTPVGEFFGELHNFETKLAMEELKSVWIAELPELTAMRKHDREQVKAFLASRKSTVRMAYARYETEFLRKTVFAGTTNNQEVLVDPTGNRRFWPMAVRLKAGKHIDRELIARTVPLVWAEAGFWHSIGMRTDLSPMFHVEHLKAAQRFTESSAIEEAIYAYLETPAVKNRYQAGVGEFIDPGELERRDKVHLWEIANECLGIDKKANLKVSDERKIKEAMGKLSHWERKEVYFGKLGNKHGKATGWIRTN